MSDIERFYSSLVNQAPVGIFRADPHGRMTFANETLLRMAGIPGDDLSDERWSSLHHPDDRARIWKAWDEVRSGSIPDEPLVYRLVRPDGSVAWAQARMIRLLDAEGSLEGYLGVVTDISRERAYRAAAEGVSRLYATLSRINAVTMQASDRDALLDAVCDTIVDVGRFDHANIELLDRDSGEVVLAHIAGSFEIPAPYHRYHIDDPATVTVGTLALRSDAPVVVNDLLGEGALPDTTTGEAKARGAASAASVPLRQSGRIIAALTVVSAERHFFNAEITALLEEIGLAISFTLDKIAQDKQKREADEARARSERLYSTLVERAPVGVLQVGADGRAVYANAAARALVGARAEDDLIAFWLAHVHPEDRAATRDYWARMQSVAGHVQLGYRLVHDDGKVVHVQAQALPIPDADGKGGYLIVITDITAETELRARAERLARLYATLSRVNTIIVQARDEATLYRQVCEAVVETGRFEWAGYKAVDWNTRRLRQIVDVGANIVPAHHRERGLDDAEVQSISNLAVLTGELIVVGDIRGDDRLSHSVRERIGKANANAAIAVPIRRGGEIVGALSIVSSVPGFFTPESVGLIDEIGRDLSFALDNLDSARRRHEAEESVARSERHLNITLRSIGDAVLVTDTRGRVTLMNPVAEALTGWPEAEAIGRPAGEVFHIVNEETRAIVESPVDRVLREGVIVGLANHTVLIARDGSECPIADSGAPIRYEDDGEVQGVVLVFRDQSVEHGMQKALRDSEQLYSTLAQNVPVGVYLADEEGELRYANDAFLRILGLEADQLSTAAAATVVHPDDRDAMARAWFDACLRRESADFGAYRYQYPDGRICWAQGMVTPVFDADGKLTCVAGVVKDITQERAHVEEIERLSRFNATVGQINAAIARGGGEQDLYAAITRVAVDKGGFAMANVCAIDPDSGRSYLPALDATAAMCDLADYVKRSVPAQRLSPATEAALATKQTIVINDLDAQTAPDRASRELVNNVGLAAVAAVPLFRFGDVAAVLVLSSAVRGYFTQDILRLLDEISLGVSHALENIERERQRRRVEEELARNEERLRLALSAHNIGIFETSLRDGRVTFDAVCARILGIGESALTLDVDPAFSMSSERDKQKLFDYLAEFERLERHSYSDESPLHLADGSTRWVRHHGVLSAERADGKPLRVLGVMTDITATKALEDRDRLAAKVIDNSSESIVILDADNRIVMSNQAAASVTGIAPGECLGQDGLQYLPEFRDGVGYEDIRRTLDAQGFWQGEVWRKRTSGESYPLLSTLSLMRDAEGRATYLIAQEIDISAQKEFEQRIRHLAYRDGLTELPNRTLLRDRVEQGIAGAAREGGSLALLFLDLDHFKNINDSLGHAVGDRLLMEIADRLTRSIREMDTVGRLGGDEFLILLPDGAADAAAHVAQKLLEECSRPFEIEAHALTVTPSIGIALYPKDGANYDELLKSADTAMYRAKDEGRNAYRFYTPEMNQAVFQRMMLESSLRRAIANDEFVLHFQPKFELRTRRLVGLEALIRWHQPEMGMVSPAQFIPVAEESGLIETIGRWALEEACKRARDWQAAGLPVPRVGVNVSARQFAAGNIADQIDAILARVGLPGAALEIEITESLLARDMGHTLDVLRKLQQLGVQIAVDDFGTGYSSLSYLKRFPIDRLKIDQSFVRDLDTDPDDRAIAAAVVTMGHSLGMRIIAEGVETMQQMEILRDMGCDEVQGYYLGRPISVDEMTRALRAYYAMWQ